MLLGDGGYRAVSAAARGRGRTGLDGGAGQQLVRVRCGSRSREVEGEQHGARQLIISTRRLLLGRLLLMMMKGSREAL